MFLYKYKTQNLQVGYMTAMQKVSFKPSIGQFPVTDGINPNVTTPYTGKSIPEDICQFSGDISADLTFNPEKSISGTIYDGTINYKDAVFKIIDEDEDMPLYYEGSIDNKKLKLASYKNECVGKYGNKRFYFTVEYNEPSKIGYFFNHTILGKNFKPDYFIIKGKLGEEDVNIKLPDTKTPQDEDVKDVLSLILFSNGLEARTFDSKIVALDYSTLKRSDIRKSKKRRHQMYKDDVKPLISQAISTASGIIIGAVMTALLGKLHLRK